MMIENTHARTLDSFMPTTSMQGLSHVHRRLPQIP